MDMKKSPVLSNRGSLVREGGVEPPRPHGHTDLNRARLPIPPLAHVSYGVSPQATHKTIRTAYGTVQLRECDLRYFRVVEGSEGASEPLPATLLGSCSIGSSRRSLRSAFLLSTLPINAFQTRTQQPRHRTHIRQTQHQQKPLQLLYLRKMRVPMNRHQAQQRQRNTRQKNNRDHQLQYGMPIQKPS